MSRPTPVSWPEAIETLASRAGVVMLVGGADVGKTTLTLAAANAAVRAGRKVAVLDTDLGQGEVGPPGTLGIVRLEAPVSTLTQVKPRALAFVGETSPIGHALQVVQAVRRLVGHAEKRRDELILVDTSGLVTGRRAEKLKLAKLEVLEPEVLVLVRRGEELARLGPLLAAATAAPVLEVQSPPEVGRKSTVYRRVTRANRMRRHFEGARLLDLDAGQVQTVDSWIYTGTPLQARQLSFASEALKTEVPHGEITADGIWLCVTRRPDRQGGAALAEEFGRKRVLYTAATAFQSLLVGLVGEGGHLLDIGLLQGVNFQRALYSILTPLRSTADVRMIHFGRLRLRADGAEITHLRPGDM